MSSAGGPHRPDDGPRAGASPPTPDRFGGPGQRRPDQGYERTPYDDPASSPPYVYNPYGNVSYPSTYPVPPAGPGGPPPAPRRPGSVHLALVVLLVAALPYLLIGLVAGTLAADIKAAVPPEQLQQLPPGVDLEQVVRTTGVVFLGVAVVFVLLAVLAWTGRAWARALLTAMAGGFVLMTLASVAVVMRQGVPIAGTRLLVLAVPVAVAGIGVALLFGRSARDWFARRRR